ncbi:hypothetical protein [Streptacidiphilus sp. P02-A3a]|uniref:hypothetical protein n=1 Tax=Streptacidiphilus sp. P02-A3a TaxID=2704468 RepID=UPI0015F8C2D1|nr:hypothetical protein [Streptacidiphilus sp. P02-A3a]QMU69734.1 hypothetical protein GXP74_17310 [Streptacidiphilus sp. P02-A3a]
MDSLAGTGPDDGRGGRQPRVRRHHILLTLWAVAWFAVVSPHGGVSWHYVRTGEQLLLGSIPGGGLALYANHPELQMGPVSFLAAGLFSPFPPAIGEALAEGLMSALGLYMLVLVGRTAADHLLGSGTNHRRLQQRVLIAGLAFIPMWTEVAVRFAHLDDVLALFFTTLAVRTLVQGRAIPTALLLALAVDSKPWAVNFLPLLLALPRSSWRPALLTAAGAIGVAWLPFYLGDLSSLAAAKFTIPNQPASSLRWFGVHSAATPWWDRPAQTGLGLALGALAVRRGRWAGVVLLGADARILLDPSVYTYYTAAILLGTLLWDTLGQRRLVPWWSWSALISLYGTALLVPSPSAQGLIRLGFVVVSSAFVLCAPSRPTRGGRHGVPQQRGRHALATSGS